MPTLLAPKLPALAPFVAPALAAAVTAATFPALPAAVETHFALDGTPNGTLPRAVFAALLPALGTGFAIAAARAQPATLARVHSGVALFLAALHGVLLARALGLPAGNLLGGLLAAFTIALGLALPKVPQNRFVGVRTPQTLACPETWARVHRWAGHGYALVGLLGLLAAGVAPRLALPTTTVGLLAVSLAAALRAELRRG